MEHVVFYPAATGVPAFRRVSSLDEAVNFVEHLRNVENITDFSVHELAPVQLSFRAYYHVQVPVRQPDGPPRAAPVAEVAEVTELAEVPAVVEVAVAAEPVAEASDAPSRGRASAEAEPAGRERADRRADRSGCRVVRWPRVRPTHPIELVADERRDAEADDGQRRRSPGAG